VSGEAVVGADVAVNKTHYTDMGTSFFRLFNLRRHWVDKEKWEKKENKGIHGCKLWETGENNSFTKASLYMKTWIN
jgi:hypothetical protein